MADVPPAGDALDVLGLVPGDVGELLVIRPGGLGDVVRSMAALRHLRRTFTRARITIVAARGVHPLLEACPWIDRLVPIDRPSEALVERFDVALSFAAPEDEASIVIDSVHAGVRVAWDRLGSGSRSAMRPEWPHRLEAGARMLRLAWLLGGDLADDAVTAYGLWPSLADRQGAARLVGGSSRPVAIVHVGASDARRRWASAHWARVLDLLERAGVEPVLVGVESERRLVRGVLEHVLHVPCDLVGSTSVGELVGLLERAILFVGTDSGPAALADAVGTRSIVIGPRDEFSYQVRPGRLDVVTAGMPRMPDPNARSVTLEPVLAQVELAVLTALEQWRAQQLA